MRQRNGTFLVMFMTPYLCQAQFNTPARPAVPNPASVKPIISDSNVIIRRLIAKGIGNGKGEFETTEEYDARRSVILDGIGSKQNFRIGESATYFDPA